jgi:hypothetical protein
MLSLCQEITKTVVVNGKEYTIRLLDDDAGFGAVCDELKITVWPANKDGRRRGMAEAEEELVRLIAANV